MHALTDKRQSVYDSSVASSAEKRRKTLSSLASIKGISKSGLASALQYLQNNGALRDNLIDTPTIGQYRRAVQSAVEFDGLKVQTTYGPPIQELLLPSDRLSRWHYLNPFAQLTYLCSVNEQLFDLVCRMVAAT